MDEAADGGDEADEGGGTDVDDPADSRAQWPGTSSEDTERDTYGIDRGRRLKKVDE